MIYVEIGNQTCAVTTLLEECSTPQLSTTINSAAGCDYQFTPTCHFQQAVTGLQSYILLLL